MFIHSVSHAVPKTYFSQADCLHAFQQASCFHQLEPSSQKLLKHVLGRDNGIEQRHLCLERIEEAFEAKPDVLHQRFEENAPKATQAALMALDKAKLLLRSKSMRCLSPPAPDICVRGSRVMSLTISRFQRTMSC